MKLYEVASGNWQDYEGGGLQETWLFVNLSTAKEFISKNFPDYTNITDKEHQLYYQGPDSPGEDNWIQVNLKEVNEE